MDTGADRNVLAVRVQTHPVVRQVIVHRVVVCDETRVMHHVSHCNDLTLVPTVERHDLVADLRWRYRHEVDDWDSKRLPVVHQQRRRSWYVVRSSVEHALQLALLALMLAMVPFRETGAVSSRASDLDHHANLVSSISWVNQPVLVQV